MKEFKCLHLNLEHLHNNKANNNKNNSFNKHRINNLIKAKYYLIYILF